MLLLMLLLLLMVAAVPPSFEYARTEDLWQASRRTDSTNRSSHAPTARSAAQQMTALNN